MAMFLGARDAHSLLRRFPRANSFLEEIRQGTIERECIEEVCSYEEVKEVFENKEKTMEFWKGYTNSVYSVKDPGHNTERSDAMYVVVPLLGVALLIVIALFIIWRCQLQKATRHRPSYAQNRYLASRTGRSLPRVMVYRERSQSQGETQYQREATNRVAGDSRAGGTPQQDGTLCPPEHSVSVLSRLPSYAQNRYRPSRTGRSLPRVMVYRERSQSQGETQYQREATNRVAGDSRAGGTPQQDGTLCPPEHSVSVLSRLSSATPPPSYEEVTGHPESSSGEETSVSYNDPPPKYEEIVAAAPAAGK
ncbi:PREDICTED: transmembrane gamma-carboxyglutamic acid protein 3 [Chaetura pelagica]|uniref:transmembrane gamma-carboxyglutamic acid protein 3 n=1 Tax=Chaetura pelagica TaxID=8897 RepID=UPI0005239DCD|nr:PREDICTED: transmembrane gamma-carboxyglutamic acid protein 3 [Chaetura pelagica]